MVKALARSPYRTTWTLGAAPTTRYPFHPHIGKELEVISPARRPDLHFEVRGDEVAVVRTEEQYGDTEPGVGDPCPPPMSSFREIARVQLPCG